MMLSRLSNSLHNKHETFWHVLKRKRNTIGRPDYWNDLEWNAIFPFFDLINCLSSYNEILSCDKVFLLYLLCQGVEFINSIQNVNLDIIFLKYILSPYMKLIKLSKSLLDAF